VLLTIPGAHGRWDQPWPLTILSGGAQKMDFRRSGTLDERRRRVLMDEIASPNEGDTTEPATGAAKGPVRAYSPAVLDERQPRVTELLPVRPLWAVCLILLGLTGIAAIEAIHIHAVTLPLKEGAQQLAALDVRERGSLAAWYSSGLLMASAVLALVTFGVRSHRVDDYRGRYRIWLWAAPALAWLSLDAATGMHDALGLGMTLLAGQQVVSAPLAAACTVTWIALYGLVLGTLGVRLAIEIWPSLPSFAALCTSGLLYLFSGLFQLDMLSAATSPLAAAVIESTIALLAHLSLLAAVGLFARHVLLDAGGRLKVHIDPEKKKAKSKHKAKLKVVKEEREPKTAAPTPAAKPGQPATAASATANARPGAAISKGSLSSPDDEEDEDDAYEDDRLSKSERRRLKKLARRDGQRRAA
jgi:hypothetical protein